MARVTGGPEVARYMRHIRYMRHMRHWRTGGGALHALHTRHTLHALLTFFTLLAGRRWRGLSCAEVGTRFGSCAKIASVPVLAAAVLPGGATAAGKRALARLTPL